LFAFIALDAADAEKLITAVDEVNDDVAKTGSF
jgi:hypothetical protein